MEDNHTLYVITGVANDHQLKAVLDVVIQEVNRVLDQALPLTYEVNIIHLRDGTKVGYGFVRVSHPEMFHLLLGRNPDGSPRRHRERQKDWVPPPPTQVKPSPSGQISWADMCDSDEETEYVPRAPLVWVSDPPLITIPSYTLDEEQQEHYIRLTLNNEKRKGFYRAPDDPIIPPTTTEFVFHPAQVDDSPSHKSSHVLFTKNIPVWLTEGMLKAALSHYASDSTTKIRRNVHGTVKFDTYPFVNLNDRRNAFITFDPKTKDAQFALLMCRKLSISGPKAESVVLFFDYALSR